MTDKRLRSKTPVSSFGPELLAALIAGAASPIEIICPSSKVATKLVQRLYTLRKRVREEGHPSAEAVQRAKVSNQRDGKHTEVIRISPHDYEYRDLLRAAGVAVEEVKGNLLGQLATEQASILESLSSESRSEGTGAANSKKSLASSQKGGYDEGLHGPKRGRDVTDPS